MTKAVNWKDFVVASPELAGAGRELLYQGAETASAFLATVAPDSGPRVHPVFPVLTDDELWLFIVNLSPKYRDLRRNPRYALHAPPTAEGGEEFHLRGRAEEVDDPELRARVVAATNGLQGVHPFQALLR